MLILIEALEEYFSRSLGLSLIALAVLCLALAGVFPGSIELSDGNEFLPLVHLDMFLTLANTVATPTSDPYAPATLIVTTVYHSSTAFYAYGHYLRTQQTSFMLGVIGSGAMAAMGIWCLLFGGQAARISKRTGADKRTSGWPFGNAEADRKRVGKKIR